MLQFSRFRKNKTRIIIVIQTFTIINAGNDFWNYSHCNSWITIPNTWLLIDGINSVTVCKANFQWMLHLCNIRISADFDTHVSTFNSIKCSFWSTDIDLKEASKAFSKKFSCGSSIQGEDEIEIQGDVKDDLFDFLPEKWPQVRFSHIKQVFAVLNKNRNSMQNENVTH